MVYKEYELVLNPADSNRGQLIHLISFLKEKKLWGDGFGYRGIDADAEIAWLEGKAKRFVRKSMRDEKPRDYTNDNDIHLYEPSDLEELLGDDDRLCGSPILYATELKNPAILVYDTRQMNSNGISWAFYDFKNRTESLVAAIRIGKLKHDAAYEGKVKSFLREIGYSGNNENIFKENRIAESCQDLEFEQMPIAPAAYDKIIECGYELTEEREAEIQDAIRGMVLFAGEQSNYSRDAGVLVKLHIGQKGLVAVISTTEEMDKTAFNSMSKAIMSESGKKIAVLFPYKTQ